MLQYRAVVHREDGHFWFEMPDFPEITHHGLLDQEDPADAAAACLAGAIILRIEEKEALPSPTPLSGFPDFTLEEILFKPVRIGMLVIDCRDWLVRGC
jgi:predicted RNase H-like HicB family nuclease